MTQSMEEQQKRIASRLNNECRECGSERLEDTHYDHDLSLKGYRCLDCNNSQSKAIPVLGETCTSCGSVAVMKGFDSANRWVIDQCADCGVLQ